MAAAKSAAATPGSSGGNSTSTGGFHGGNNTGVEGFQGANHTGVEGLQGVDHAGVENGYHGRDLEAGLESEYNNCGGAGETGPPLLGRGEELAVLGAGVGGFLVVPVKKREGQEEEEEEQRR